MMELSEKALHREGSLCSPDPHQQLFKAFQDRDLPNFENILKQGTQNAYIDPNHWYEDPHLGTLLDVACRKPNNSLYIQSLLLAGADPNKINPKRKKSPLHFTIEANDLQSFEIILKHSASNPNILDNFGNSPLHYAAKLDNTEFLIMLVNHSKININVSNKKGQTALHIAAQEENSKAVSILLSSGIDADSTKNAAGKTGRDLVMEHLPELKRELSTGKIVKGENDSVQDLFNMLRNRELDMFVTALRVQDKNSLNNHNGSHTYLQYACDFGLEKAVDALIREGADVNTTHPANLQPPLMIAGYRGYVHIIRLILHNDSTNYTDVNGENVLHSIIKGMANNQLPLGASKENRDHLSCLKYVLDVVPRSKLDINCGDVKGNTPLHYAAKHGNHEVTLLLLSHGVYIGQRNTLGQPAFADINPRVLENYLDECLTTNDKLTREENYEIIFNYNFLAPPKVSTNSLSSSHTTLQIESHAEKIDENLSETDPLLYMSRSSDFRHLLKHPIFTSFIHLKWHKIRRFFFYNLTFYVIFWILLTGYILGFYGAQKSQIKDDPATNISRIKRDLFEKESNQSGFSESLRILVAIFLMFLIVREIFQFIISPIQYICNPENWLEITLIGITLSIVFGNTTAHQEISAIAILLSWAELILLIGRLPANSTNIEMLKTVSWNFLKFLAWYSILIIAFALSFYTLFRDSTDSDEKFFTEPATSMFKTVVMLTGEFDVSSIPFVDHPGVSHILFVMFVFLIAIVLFNLLNGLAVSDTQAIRADAELVGYVSQVKLVSYIETMAIGDPTPFKDLIEKIKAICCYVPDTICCSTQFSCLKIFSRKINLFTELQPDYEVRILPNQENKVRAFENGYSRKRHELEDEETHCYDRCSIITMDPTIVKAAKEIISKRTEDQIYMQRGQNYSDSDKLIKECKSRLDQYHNQIEVMKKSTEKTQEMVQRLLDLLTNKNKGLVLSSSDEDNQ